MQKAIRREKKAIRRKKKAILRKKVASKRCGLSVRQTDRLSAAGKFPRPVKLGLRATGYLEHEIEAWIEQRASDRSPSSVTKATA